MKEPNKPLLVPLFYADSSHLKRLRDIWIQSSEEDKRDIEREARENLKTIIESWEILFNTI
jgi:hypothetical protein